MSELKPRFFSGTTAYRDLGHGEVIVFIHGVGLNADAWEPQIEYFSKNHRVIAIDMLGHGSTAVPSSAVSLVSYVEQVAELLDELAIASANIIGHSMGGLVAVGFALAHPTRTKSLAALNSVYKRSAQQREAVQNRASEIVRSGTLGNIEAPLERWFGPRTQEPPIAQQARHWLNIANAKGYAMAYTIFASSDNLYAGQLHHITMPSIFLTGSDDANSTSSMTMAMAAETANGQALVIAGARHMMNLTHSKEVNAALQNLLDQHASTLDPKELRKAFGTFMTGVTVVTTCDAAAGLRGFTANSFSSVSLDPPLLLVCIAKSAGSYDVFARAKYFAVNILAETQKAISGTFASKNPNKFADIAYTKSASGNPLLSDTVAWFDCASHQVVEAGDHIILIGRITSFAQTDASPLGYARGGYFTLGLEQSAVNAASHASGAEVGAILEFENKLMVFANNEGNYELPHVGLSGAAGSTTRLMEKLMSQGVAAKLGFLFAVYENRENHTQSIYYRGEAETAGTAQLLEFDNLDFEKFRDHATRAMVKRYCSERLQGRYKIYSGDHISGDVRALTS